MCQRMSTETDVDTHISLRGQAQARALTQRQTQPHAHMQSQAQAHPQASTQTQVAMQPHAHAQPFFNVSFFLSGLSLFFRSLYKVPATYPSSWNRPNPSYFPIFKILCPSISPPFCFFNTRLPEPSSQAGGSGPNFHISKFSKNCLTLFLTLCSFYTSVPQQSSQAGGSGRTFHISKFSEKCLTLFLFLSSFLHQVTRAKFLSRWLRIPQSYFPLFEKFSPSFSLLFFFSH